MLEPDRCYRGPANGFPPVDIKSNNTKHAGKGRSEVRPRVDIKKQGTDTKRGITEPTREHVPVDIIAA